MPRSSHADCEATADRPDPIDLLERPAESRIAELVPIRYGRMLVSPFTFYRGAAAIMASDLAALPRTRLVVAGQRVMQAASDIFLGWRRMTTNAGTLVDFYARQLKDLKGSVELGVMPPDEMAAYGRTCGWALARGHARSGDRIAIASYLGGGTSFDGAMVGFAEAYADQTERDHEALVEAARSGRIEAETGL